MIYAIQTQDENITAKLLSASADIEKEVSTSFNTPLHEAALAGWTKGVSLLCKGSANVNRKHRESENTALHIAALHGHTGVVSALLGYGAESEVHNRQGLKPRDLAIQAGFSDIANAFTSYIGN